MTNLVRFLIVLVLFRRSENDILRCPANGPCRKAFLTSNPMTLKCGEWQADTPISWQYLEAMDPYINPVTFLSSSGPVELPGGLNSGQHQTIASLTSRAKLAAGNLTIRSPLAGDTGLYICKGGQETLASYQVDFQDASRIHISHATLMQGALPNSVTDLADKGTLQMFTAWSDWQPCDRCSSPGERKRIGYCYAELSKDAILLAGPMPCGLLRASFKEVSFTRPPELRIETCQEACTVTPPANTSEVPVLVIDNYHTLSHADASITCPESTIYKPVYWMHGTKSPTRLQQMLKKTSYIMDDATGGGTLTIHMLNTTERGFFDCYVDRQLTGRFDIIFPDVKLTPEPEKQSKGDYIIMGLGVFLFISMNFAAFRMCIKSTQRVIH